MVLRRFSIVWALQIGVYVLFKLLTGIQIEMIYLFLAMLTVLIILGTEVSLTRRKMSDIKIEKDTKDEDIIDETTKRLREDIRNGSPVFWFLVSVAILFIAIPYIGYYMVFR